jgi:hypothetical protein
MGNPNFIASAPVSRRIAHGAKAAEQREAAADVSQHHHDHCG